MTVQSLSFDDDDDEELYVFSGYDLLISHYDIADLDWQEAAERSAIDERRGLVIAQVGALEDLIDEFLLYLEDPEDIKAYQRRLDTQTIGPRLDQLVRLLRRAELFDLQAQQQMDELRTIVRRRNQLAHGTIYWRPVKGVAIKDPGREPFKMEWVMVDRRSRTSERISMAGLRRDLYAAIGAFSAMLSYAESFVKRAPRPINFLGRTYLGPPTP